ncbi:hypothetical protein METBISCDRAFT_31412 [Metschnikowia bicuspidata]|uniref:Uncharacterized protein n=1 Tax=Metschnikowia bicuspidata TaxID=27322 RepID=A0A4P9ZAG1_9ASCO|nr:hypothetical protein METBISCDRAFT_31412 [Metschnikowia bicuspidata]
MHRPVYDSLYAEDDSFITGIEASVLATPLRRLPDTRVNDARQTVVQARLQEPESINSHAARYSLFDGLALVPFGNPAVQRKTHFGVHRPTEPQYESPTPPNDEDVVLSLPIGGPLILDDFMPPRANPKAGNPIIVSSDYKHKETVAIDVPRGQWTSPVVEQALRRQVNKEQQFKALWANVVRLFFFHMALLLGQYLYQLYLTAYCDENQMYRNTMWTRIYSLRSFQGALSYAAAAYGHVRTFQWVFVALIAANVVRFVRPQDQCRDLPLTKQQRELIGLLPLDEHSETDGVDSDLIVKQRLFRVTTSTPLLVPKYAQENVLSGFMRAAPRDDSDVTVALKDLLLARNLRRS